MSDVDLDALQLGVEELVELVVGRRPTCPIPWSSEDADPVADIRAMWALVEDRSSVETVRYPSTGAAIRLIACDADVQPTSIADVIVVDPGDSQYDPMPGYRDVGVAFSNVLICHEYARSWITFKLRMISVDRDDSVFDATSLNNLIMMWQGDDFVVHGRLFVRCRAYESVIRHTQDPTDTSRPIYVVRWSYREAIDLEELS